MVTMMLMSSCTDETSIRDEEMFKAAWSCVQVSIPIVCARCEDVTSSTSLHATYRQLADERSLEPRQTTNKHDTPRLVVDTHTRHSSSTPRFVLGSN